MFALVSFSPLDHGLSLDLKVSPPFIINSLSHRLIGMLIVMIIRNTQYEPISRQYQSTEKKKKKKKEKTCHDNLFSNISKLSVQFFFQLLFQSVSIFAFNRLNKYSFFVVVHTQFARIRFVNSFIFTTSIHLIRMSWLWLRDQD